MTTFSILAGPTKYSASRAIDELAVAAFGGTYALFIDSSQSANTTEGKAARFTFSGEVVGTGAAFDGANDDVYSPWAAKITSTKAIIGWLYDSSGTTPILKAADNSDPPTLGAGLELSETYPGIDDLKVIRLSDSRSIAMTRRGRRLYNVGISGTTLSEVATEDMLTETLGVRLTDICRLDDSTALLIAAQGALTTTSYVEGTATCSSSNCGAGMGTPDDIGCSGITTGYHQIEFTEKLIGATTAISMRWKTLSGNYGNLYQDARIDGEWVAVRFSASQGTANWRWETDADLSPYEGRQLSGTRLRFDTSTGGHTWSVDSHRITNFYDPNPGHSAWVIHTTDSGITYGAQAYLPHVIGCLSVIGISTTQALVLYCDYDSDDATTGLKAMALSLTGDNVTENTATLLKHADVTAGQLLDLGAGRGEYGVIYEESGAVYFRTCGLNGSTVLDGENQLSIGSYTLENAEVYDANNVIGVMHGASNDGYYVLLGASFDLTTSAGGIPGAVLETT